MGMLRWERDCWGAPGMMPTSWTSRLIIGDFIISTKMCCIPGCQCHSQHRRDFPSPGGWKKASQPFSSSSLCPPSWGLIQSPLVRLMRGVPNPVGIWALPVGWDAASLGQACASLLQDFRGFVFRHQIPFCHQEWRFEEQHPKGCFASLPLVTHRHCSPLKWAPLIRHAASYSSLRLNSAACSIAYLLCLILPFTSCTNTVRPGFWHLLALRLIT